jgi:hypothetical protein
MDTEAFGRLMHGVRAADPAAAAELVRRFGPPVRRAIRSRLLRTGPRPRARLGGRLAAGAGQLLHAGRRRSVRADNPVAVGAAAGDHGPQHARQPGPEGGRPPLPRRAAERPRPERPGRAGARPDREVAARELLGAVYWLLAPAELDLLELRTDGHDWATIAVRRNGDPVVLRKRLSRALVRVACELKLDSEYVG